jgi:hypothetical protein
MRFKPTATLTNLRLGDVEKEGWNRTAHYFHNLFLHALVRLVVKALAVWLVALQLSRTVHAHIKDILVPR